MMWGQRIHALVILGLVAATQAVSLHYYPARLDAFTHDADSDAFVEVHTSLSHADGDAFVQYTKFTPEDPDRNEPWDHAQDTTWEEKKRTIVPPKPLADEGQNNVNFGGDSGNEPDNTADMAVDIQSAKSNNGYLAKATLYQKLEQALNATRTQLAQATATQAKKDKTINQLLSKMKELRKSVTSFKTNLGSMTNKSQQMEVNMALTAKHHKQAVAQVENLKRTLSHTQAQLNAYKAKAAEMLQAKTLADSAAAKSKEEAEAAQALATKREAEAKEAKLAAKYAQLAVAKITKAKTDSATQVAAAKKAAAAKVKIAQDLAKKKDAAAAAAKVRADAATKHAQTLKAAAALQAEASKKATNATKIAVPTLENAATANKPVQAAASKSAAAAKPAAAGKAAALLETTTLPSNVDSFIQLSESERSPVSGAISSSTPKEMDETVLGDVEAMVPQNEYVLPIAIKTDGQTQYPVATVRDGPSLLTKIGMRVEIKGEPIETDLGDTAIEVRGFKVLGPANV